MALLFFILIMIIHNFSENNQSISLLLNAYEITLKVGGTGTNSILHPSYPCPSQIYLNKTIQNLTDCHSIYINQLGSEIKMVWDGPINSTYRMFYERTGITEVDLTHFDTSLVVNMNYMFYCCHSLTSVDLSNLNTKNVISMNNMFNHCYSMVSINLENFETSSVLDMSYLFARSTLLEYINLKNFKETDNTLISSMFSGIKENAVICLNFIKSPRIFNLLKQISCITISCETNWRSVQNNLTNCNEINAAESEIELEEKAAQNARDVMKNLNNFDIDKNDIVIKQKGSTITFSNSDNQKNGKSPNTTNIDLVDCEDKIKEAYNIPKNKSLYILKLDIKLEGLQIPKIEYEVYYYLEERISN